MCLDVPNPAFPLAIPIGRDGIGLLPKVVFFGSFPGPLWCSEMDPKWNRKWIPNGLGSGLDLGSPLGTPNWKIELEIQAEIEVK